MAAAVTWDSVLDDMDDADLGIGVNLADGGDPSDDGFLMTSGLKNANKCRDCSKTLDVGTPAWCEETRARAQAALFLAWTGVCRPFLRRLTCG